MHEGGFRIEKDYRDRWFFRRPDGRAVPACGYRAADMTDDDVEMADEAVKAYLSAADATRTSAEVLTVREPSSEVYTAAAPFREGWMPDQTSAEGFSTRGAASRVEHAVILTYFRFCRDGATPPLEWSNPRRQPSQSG